MKKILKMFSNRKFKMILILTFLLFIYTTICAYSYAKNISSDISDSIFRLHVIANSDSTEDQDLKYIVIDSEGATASVVRKVIVNGKSQSLTAIVNKKEAENISTTVTIEAETDSDKVYYAVTTTDKKPGDSEYKELVNKRVSLNIVKNGRYYIFIKDSKGNITKKEIEVTNIDETKPSCSFEEGGYVEKGKTKEIG